MYFFQYSFERARYYFVPVMVKAVYCAKHDSCLAFCRFRCRSRKLHTG